MFWKTKFYPVNFNQKIIYDAPKDRESQCWKPGFTIGIRGHRLNTYACYKQFTMATPQAFEDLGRKSQPLVN